MSWVFTEISPCGWSELKCLQSCATYNYPVSYSFPWYLFFVRTCGISPEHHNVAFSRNLPDTMQIYDFFPYLWKFNFPQHSKHLSQSSQLSASQHSKTAVLCLDSFSLCQKVLQAESRVLWDSFVSLLSEVIVLVCLFSKDWKELFHLFCPVLWLFMAEGLIWYQLWEYTLFKWGFFVVVMW